MKECDALRSLVIKASHCKGSHSKASLLIGHVILALPNKDSITIGLVFRARTTKESDLAIPDNVLTEPSRFPCIHLGTTGAGKVEVELMR